MTSSALARTHEAHEVLGATRAGDLTECRLGLAEDRRLSRGDAHVARQHEFATGGPNTPLDPRDGFIRCRNCSAMDASPVSFAAFFRHSSILVKSTWDMK
jgi:hypothetical protein